MTPEQIIKRKIQEILDCPQMYVGNSVQALEATLFALLSVLLEIRGEDSYQIVPILRRLSAQTFGSGSASPAFRTPEPYVTIGDHPEILQMYKQWVDQVSQSEYAPVLLDLEQLPVSLARHRAKSFVLAVQTAVQNHPPIQPPKITLIPLNGARIEITVENFMRSLTMMFDSLGDTKITPKNFSYDGSVSWTATPPLDTWIQWVTEPLSPVEYYKVLVRALFRERKKREIDPKEEAQIAQQHEKILELIPEASRSDLETWIEEQKNLWPHEITTRN